MKVMLEGSALLEKKSIGTNAARTAIWNVACIAYYRATGLWLENDKEPRGTNLLGSKVKSLNRMSSSSRAIR